MVSPFYIIDKKSESQKFSNLTRFLSFASAFAICTALYVLIELLFTSALEVISRKLPGSLPGGKTVLDISLIQGFKEKETMFISIRLL